ncbi:MAG: ribosome maturation factor RimP [Gordonia sp. (in: high G+C Gram-positive bacteria)]
MPATDDAIGDLVRPVLAELGYDLEDVSAPAGGKRDLRILVDRDGGASLDDLADVSRELGTVLDASDVLGDTPYDLEVSTPGIGRPLTAPRHWRRARGRTVTVRLAGGDTVTGRIAGSDDTSATLLHNDKGRFTTTDIPLSGVEKAKLEVEFTRPGPAELRACGLDDDEIERRRRPAE